MAMRSSRVILVAAAGGFALRLALKYADLPVQMASHFGSGGVPNGWMPRSIFVGFSVALSAVMLLIFLGGPMLLRRVPHALINLPHKQYWLAPERKEAAFDYLASTIEWMGAATFVFLVLVNELVFAANAKVRPQLSEAPLIVGLVIILSVSIGSGVAMYLHFSRIPKDAKVARASGRKIENDSGE